jgi:hypothetical protein
MAIQGHLVGNQAASDETTAPIVGALTLFARGAKTWLQTCADYWTAAAVYDELNRLSNAELTRRGLSRDTLARDACSAFDRSLPG